MDLKRLLVVAALVAAGVYFWNHRAGAHAPSPGPSSEAAQGGSWDAGTCIRLADSANSALQEASRLFLHLPVDQGSWRDAEGRVQSAISGAESACGGASSEKDRAAADEVRAALGGMRALLGELSAAASGGGGTSILQRQEEIERHLDAARGRLRP